ncbi:glycoside hydrolase family 130 protein [Oceanispirochaeta sp.]|uniref:glycoside hydrolase family 130 protein n=1 Tax=Oceanispirochaeta sp. TaxID=2035350 RepID=UPI0026096257|nr:glycoside hydrolase family 130 protein [Oceanispirochaeta sp.]MDA3957225.1 glycoside hydrolase family 130 protein [Oceanispirochaeta sp.]
MQVNVKRRDITFNPDFSRVIARYLYTGDERSAIIIRSVLELSDEEVKDKLNQVLRRYSKRHRNISQVFEKHYKLLADLFTQMEIDIDSIDLHRRNLIGAYFTMEYSIEAAAFFNPSIVESPDQMGLVPGEKRVILSFRATGEGHLSSIVFRSGILNKDGHFTMDPVGTMLAEADRIKRHVYHKEQFLMDLNELQEYSSGPTPSVVLSSLGDDFTYGELETCIRNAPDKHGSSMDEKAFFNQIMWLASSHYEIEFTLDSSLCERVIFPISSTERRGIEDARFVRFTEENQTQYYGTYTAYDGISTMPKLIETKDFYHFKVHPLHGNIAKNKGMALFPRKIRGQYAMLCRMDGRNNYISFSDNINIWNEAKMVQSPRYTWEFIQVGNCGSPLETEDGWLVITHGVGPMREYVLGALLLDLENPEIEIGRLDSPLLAANEVEREGSVPNVVYSCGSIIHNEDLILPYAVSDYSSTYCTVNLKELLAELKREK